MSAQPAMTLLLTGDSMITRRPALSLDEPVRGLVERIRAADVAFTNLEVLPNDFRGDPAQESGGTHLAAHSWVLDELIDMGFNIAAAATNHALDYGVSGLLATLETLDRKGIAYAGIGRNLAEARMPVYRDTPAGSVALISCCSTFAAGQQAGEQRPDMQGRPGLNPLRVTTTYEITADQMEALQGIATQLGVERQRQERVRLGFAFPPDDPDLFSFLDARFRVADRPAIRTTANAGDVEAIVTWTREARARADLVIVSVHGHEQGATKEELPEFLPSFARHVIDEGADVVIGHGPHLLRGMEIYQGKPIFYSLGNFIAQNDLVHKLPADAYERFRVDPGKTPSEIARSRGQDGARGFPADRRYWETIVPICRFEDGQLREIDLAPVTLGHQQPTRRRGQPRLARGEEAAGILSRFATLSAPFGTTIEQDGPRARVALNHG